MMKATEIINLEQTLLPITEDNRVGEDLRSDTSPNALYYQIKDARSLARTAERQAAQDNESPALALTNWKLLSNLCVKALSEQTKDLELACWLTEALVRTNGFDGLIEGFRLLRGLVENYWPAVYPTEEEEDGWAAKLAALVGLNGESNAGTLITPIHCIPITEQIDGRSYATWEYQQALETAKLADPEAKKQRIASGSVTLEQIQAAVSSTKKEFYLALDADLQNCAAEFDTLYKVLAEKCGEFCPPSSNIRHAIEDCAGAVKTLTKNMFAADDSVQLNSAEDAGSATSFTGDSNASFVAGDRKSAFAQIAKVADFFRRTEPHSPLSYLLERAVRWGDMTLPDLMKELLADSNSYFSYCKLVGIEPPKPEMPAQAGPAPYMSDAGMGGYSPPNTGFNPNPASFGNEQFGMPPNSPGFNNF
jgi:type VI secretion system protein ImpA